MYSFHLIETILFYCSLENNTLFDLSRHVMMPLWLSTGWTSLKNKSISSGIPFETCWMFYLKWKRHKIINITKQKFLQLKHHEIACAEKLSLVCLVTSSAEMGDFWHKSTFCNPLSTLGLVSWTSRLKKEKLNSFKYSSSDKFSLLIWVHTQASHTSGEHQILKQGRLWLVQILSRSQWELFLHEYVYQLITNMDNSVCSLSSY